MSQENQETQPNTDSQQSENEGLQNLLRRYNNDWAALAGELYSQTAKLREQRRTAEGERDAAKEQLPKDGQRVLSKADAERYDAFTALNLKPDEIKTSLEQAQADRQALTTAGNKEALQTLGLKPSVLRLREFDGAVITAAKDKDGKVSGTVKVGDTETSYEQFVKDKGLEGDLKDFALQPAGVVVVPQHAGGGAAVGPKTVEQRQQEKQTSGDYSL